MRIPRKFILRQIPAAIAQNDAACLNRRVVEDREGEHEEGEKVALGWGQ
jgi:hypothetical protein